MKRHLFIACVLLFVFTGCSEEYWYDKHLRDTHGNYEQKLEDFSKAIDNDPENAGLYLQRAKLLSSLAQVTLAKRDLDRAIELDPGLAEARLLRGYLLLRIRPHDYRKAIEEMTRAIELYPRYASAYFWRATARFEVRRFPECLGYPKAQARKYGSFDTRSRAVQGLARGLGGC